jgi:hypothetical protein
MNKIIAMIFAVLLEATFVASVGDGYPTSVTELIIRCSCKLLCMLKYRRLNLF